MKLLVIVALVFCVSTAVSLKEKETHDLPPGYSSASELAQVLENEPTAAQQVRFVATGAGLPGDTVTFRDSSSSFTPGVGSSTPTDPQIDEINAEYDGQIEDVKKQVKALRVAIKESEQCARHLTEQRAQLQSLDEQKEHLEKEKEKAILEAKLQKQMKDLAEINHMSRSLRTKFAELKRTQQLIKTRMTGTRSSLNQLDEMDTAVDLSGLTDTGNKLGADVDAMHAAQKRILDGAHKTGSTQVKQTVRTTNENLKALKDQMAREARELAKEITRQK